MNFGCSRCGECCRHVRHILPALDPGWPVNDDGSCGHLTTAGTCGIYDRRPPVCRVDDMRPAGVDEHDWLAANADACAALQAAAGLDVDRWRPTIIPQPLESPCSVSCP